MKASRCPAHQPEDKDDKANPAQTRSHGGSLKKPPSNATPFWHHKHPRLAKRLFQIILNSQQATQHFIQVFLSEASLAQLVEHSIFNRTFTLI
tara:strand:+ start:92 stop:370 length:279 start_codon:yes stop_codon:yes gene_type:complete